MTGVIYARYSSDNQREESIEGQLRECKAFAEKNDIQIVNTYIDRALSAKTDNRPSFQQMVKDSTLFHQTESGRNSRLDSVFFPGEAFASQAASKPFAPSIPAVGNSRSADFSFYGNASVVVSQTKNRFDR